MSAVAPIGTAKRTGQRLYPDVSRTVTRLFVAGQEEVGGGESRAAEVIARVLALDEGDVALAVDELLARFGGSHKGFVETLLEHATRVDHRVASGVSLSDARRILLGATFTHEYAIEAAALCNPSMVEHPDQQGVGLGSLRFVMSVRGIGEGHRSSIGFRTGQIGPDGSVVVDLPEPFAIIGKVGDSILERAVIHGKLRELADDGESTAFVLNLLDDHFTVVQLDRALDTLHHELATRHTADQTIARLRSVCASTYSVQFASETDLSERVLWPTGASESHGMEDARFVRFVDDDGRVRYLATYTAFDGAHVAQHLLETTDFLTFFVSPTVGGAAANKGLAIFPRRVDGRYYALSRSDRETNSIAASDNVRRWDDSGVCQQPARVWDLIQLGNCGSPIETDAGWLVLTHGVGAMRTYSIGALLLDIADPTKVLGSLRDPLLTPMPDERHGYVPNVVYSCGAMIHANTLVVPYGIADGSIGIATVAVDELVARLRRDGV